MIRALYSAGTGMTLAYSGKDGGGASLNVTQLNQLVARTKIHIESLTEAYKHVHTQDLLDLRTLVETCKSEAEKLLKAHQARANKVLNSTISEPKDISTLLAELRALFGIFDE